MNETQTQDNKITKVLYNQVSLFVALVGVVSSVLFWITNPQVAVTARVQAVEQEVDFNKADYQKTEEFQSQTLVEIKKDISTINDTKLVSIEQKQVEILQAIARLEAQRR